MLRRACADAALWRRLRVAVNLSPLQFRTGNLLSIVMDALKQSGCPRGGWAGNQSCFGKSGQVLATLRHCRRSVRISMDDFGTAIPA